MLRILSVSSLLLATTSLVSADDATYNVNAICTCDQMMRYYGTSHDGLWGGSWWQSAILMASLADISSLDSSYNGTYFNTYSNTYSNAPSFNGYTGFLDDFYDDEGWWGNAWLTVYDLTKNSDYLNLAISIYNDISGGVDTPCGGGLYWEKGQPYIASIANELYIALAAGLANRVPSDQAQPYLDAATSGWDWFVNIGVIDTDWLVVDGVDNTTCQPTGSKYSYNQGVILSAAVELATATGHSFYLETAGRIANATTATNGTFTDENGVLKDCATGCDVQGAMFKGPFFRGLRQLQLADPHDNWKDFITTNAQSLWNHALNDTNGDCNTGASFAGPMSDVNEVTQGAALDCLVAAWAVTS
ncbi:glycosyl hydrolase [Talaromyces proteolyticus]|uniref:Glycosyl hydrolase n=1 Tax=Talaromyces proteolyticus TaxID=1131652 RepID=A0AAD4L4S5_9EURO|nr:glycosyl hydrolase [Talaromyces proteolyticus]KAH8704203.1 glycosyl hydrolase [Talaromyces proteolyticus]